MLPFVLLQLRRDDVNLSLIQLCIEEYKLSSPFTLKFRYFRASVEKLTVKRAFYAPNTRGKASPR